MVEKNNVFSSHIFLSRQGMASERSSEMSTQNSSEMEYNSKELIEDAILELKENLGKCRRGK
jgi:hypothetical protein